MDKKLKDTMTTKLKHAMQLTEDAKNAQEAKKSGKRAQPKKTITHRIVRGMTIKFKDGQVVKYNVGAVDTIYCENASLYHRASITGLLTWPGWLSAIRRSGFKHKINDFDKDVSFEYEDVEKEKSINAGTML